MAGERVSWNDATQGSTIAGLEQQILEMKTAASKILPEIDVLKPNWKTEGSKKTIVDLEMFLKNDFEDFVKLFNITVEKLVDLIIKSKSHDELVREFGVKAGSANLNLTKSNKKKNQSGGNCCNK